MTKIITLLYFAFMGTAYLNTTLAESSQGFKQGSLKILHDFHKQGLIPDKDYQKALKRMENMSQDEMDAMVAAAKRSLASSGMSPSEMDQMVSPSLDSAAANVDTKSKGFHEVQKNIRKIIEARESASNGQ